MPIQTPSLKPLRGVRIVSLALNLPGPAALMRLCAMGATCVKVEPVPPTGAKSGDPMGQYNQTAYSTLHQGMRIVHADLKSEKGQKLLAKELAKAHVLLTSFRPSAMARLGLTWKTLHKAFPALSQVAIVGAPGERAEEPGHDLTYLADNGLVTGLDLPPTLYADMGGSLMASEAVLQALLHQRAKAKPGKAAPGVFMEVALSEAASYLALPRTWGLTLPQGSVGGAHAGYRVYACKDGRVALAALEPHFAATLCAAAGISTPGRTTLFEAETHKKIAAFLRKKTCAELSTLAAEKDIPLHVMPTTEAAG